MFGTNSLRNDEEENFESLFEDGHWEWDDHCEQLVFKSHQPQRESSFKMNLPLTYGPIQFKDELDIIDELRFRKLYQRKTGEDDVVILQDVKDLVLYTAPIKMLSLAAVTVLHLSTTDRFFRALILYCQYYLQVSEEISKRSLELETKIRTDKSDEIETEFQTNLEDIRLLVAKEYCNVILGHDDFKKYHHMGSSKKMQSLTKKEAHLFETVLRLGIQIAWIALGRKSFNQIETEIHRIFKSPIFNVAEHRLDSNNYEKNSKEEQKTLLGQCVHYRKKLNTQSPLANEIFCSRHIDFRIFGLGTIRYDGLPCRLRYFEQMIIAPEILLSKYERSLGIIGLPRANFDTMLRKINLPPSSASASSSGAQRSIGRLASARMSKSSAGGMQKSTTSAAAQPLYNDIVIPETSHSDITEFPTEALNVNTCNMHQRKKWIRWMKSNIARKNKKH